MSIILPFKQFEMFIKAIENLTLERLFEDAMYLNLDKSNSYIQSYPVFLNFFKGIENIEKEHLVISAHFVYGWMPTIIHLELEDLKKILEILNKVKCGEYVDKNEIEILKTSINNSMVGLSKLLHFINPEDYAIWDSRIFRYITKKKSTYGIDRPDYYLAYLDKLRSISSLESYQELHSLISNHFDYPLTPMRAIEVMMFESDKRLQNISKILNHI